MNYFKLLKKIPGEKRGFTILETLVAITVIMIAIVGPLTVSERALVAAVYARDQLVASYLAQDALEYMHFLRNSAVLAGRTNAEEVLNGGAYVNLSTFCPRNNSQTPFPEGGCTVDTTLEPADTPLVAANVNNDSMSQDATTGVYRSYQAPSGTYFTTHFKRRVYVERPNAANDKEVRVTVIVVWNNGAVENSVKLTSHLFAI